MITGTRIAALAAAALALGGLLLWAFQIDTTPAPSPDPPSAIAPAPPPTAPPTAERPAPPPPPGPNHALRSDRPAPERAADLFPSAPPAAEPDIWEARRDQAAQTWWAQTEEALDRFAESQGLDPARAQAAHATLDRMHQEIATVRRAITTGATAPKEGRVQMAEARARAAEALNESLGEATTESLRQTLKSEVMGGGF